MKKTSISGERVENVLLAHAISERIKRSGLSARGFFNSINESAYHAHYSYLINSKRGISFWKAIKIANKCGIDLGKLQRKIIRYSSPIGYKTPKTP